ALAAAIVRLLRDRELARGLAEAGRREVLARYGADQIAAELEALYAPLVGGGGPGRG
ncbi:MAG: glycosyltransferase family 4 protein, partial [Chloroflexales bacterium]|nr:glycosyltransferase family 4 protein [Chloroflexales bacterium]